MYKDHRDFLKDSIRKRVDFSRTAQSRGVAPPPLQKPVPAGAVRIPLVPPGTWTSIPGVDLETAVAHRKSRRRYSGEGLSFEELSFLLWATQGLRASVRGGVNFRTVPSAGNRHPLETYVIAFRVSGLEKAAYRYLPLDHALVETGRSADLEERLITATFGPDELEGKLLLDGRVEELVDPAHAALASSSMTWQRPAKVEPVASSWRGIGASR